MITTRSLLPASCLCAFTKLQSLSVDFTEEDSETQETRLKSIFRPRQLLALTLLTSLTFTTLAIIDTYLLNQIADNFPLLQILKVSCTERLNFESFDSFIKGVETTLHSPIPGTYATASELARQFADALQPLTNLKHLHLGVFLSSAQLLNRHINHFDDSDYRVEKSKKGPDLHSCPMCGAMHNIILYGPGDCKLCLEHAETVRQYEIDASLILAQVLKNMESVGWSSFFANRRKSRKKRVLNQMDLEGKMTVWIVRTEGLLGRALDVWWFEL